MNAPIIVDEGIKWGRYFSGAGLVIVCLLMINMIRITKRINLLVDHVKDLHDRAGGIPVGDIKVISVAISEVEERLLASQSLTRQHLASNHDEIDSELRMSNEKLGWVRSKLQHFHAIMMESELEKARRLKGMAAELNEPQERLPHDDH